MVCARSPSCRLPPVPSLPWVLPPLFRRPSRCWGCSGCTAASGGQEGGRRCLYRKCWACTRKPGLAVQAGGPSANEMHGRRGGPGARAGSSAPAEVVLAGSPRRSRPEALHASRWAGLCLSFQVVLFSSHCSILSVTLFTVEMASSEHVRHPGVWE